MGKRGPKAADEYEGKTKVFSSRMTAELEKALRRATKISKRSFSGEVEYRLRRSFEEDQKIGDQFGNRKIYAILRAVGGAMEAVGETLGPLSSTKKGLGAAGWLDDPNAYDQALKAAVFILTQFRPDGDIAPLSVDEFPNDKKLIDKWAVEGIDLSTPEARKKIRDHLHLLYRNAGLLAGSFEVVRIMAAPDAIPSNISDDNFKAAVIASDIGLDRSRALEKMLRANEILSLVGGSSDELAKK